MIEQTAQALPSEISSHFTEEKQSPDTDSQSSSFITDTEGWNSRAGVGAAQPRQGADGALG